MPLPQINDPIEDFTLKDQDGDPVSLSEFKKTPVVLFFLPRADSAACTIEACGFRDIYAKFKQSGITVYGISRDTIRDLRDFKLKHTLPYDLLSDPELELINRFDLLKSKFIQGKPATSVKRTTFLIARADTEGKQRLFHIFESVTPAGHAEEVFNLLRWG